MAGQGGGGDARVAADGAAPRGRGAQRGRYGGLPGVAHGVCRHGGLALRLVAQAAARGGRGHGRAHDGILLDACEPYGHAGRRPDTPAPDLRRGARRAEHAVRPLSRGAEPRMAAGRDGDGDAPARYGRYRAARGVPLCEDRGAGHVVFRLPCGRHHARGRDVGHRARRRSWPRVPIR